MPDNSPSNPLDSSNPLKLNLPSLADRRVLVAIAIQLNDLAHDYTPAELGRVVGLSGSRLSALTTDHLGIPLHRFFKQERMTSAAHLFATQFLTVSEVMVRVGFHDKSHFSRSFKEAYGISPGKYRQLCLKDKKSHCL